MTRHREPRSGAAIQILWIASSPLAPRDDGVGWVHDKLHEDLDLCEGLFLKGDRGI